MLDGLERVVQDSPRLGVPHIGVAFPHVVHMYRIGDPRVQEEQETNVYDVGLANTRSLSLGEDVFKPLEGFIGCPGEILLLGEEMAFWAAAKTVDDYLQQFVPEGNRLEVARPNKLYHHLNDS